MDRTESVVTQVAPSYENEKIREMEGFGWSLQGRQEIHEEGDAEGRRSLFGDTYVVTTKVKHYVKLHFVRSLELNNLKQIRTLETEYRSLAYPEAPSVKGAAVMIVLGLFGLWVGSGSAGIVLISLLMMGVGGYIVYSAQKTKQSNAAILEDSRSRGQRILAEAGQLLG